MAGMGMNMNKGIMNSAKRMFAGLLVIMMLTGLMPTFALAEVQTEEGKLEKSGTALTTVDDTFTEDKWKLILNYPSLFSRMTYRDDETGLYIHYSIYLPEKYDPEKKYPLVVFLADENSTGTNPETPVAQGRGGLVWAAAEWQAAYPCIVAIPLYRERILDNQLYTVTDYVEVTYNWIGMLGREYGVDTTRIYGTGQGMGCETVMLLANEHRDLFAACMLVSGQWDAERLTGLEKQKFVFFSAVDDTEMYSFAEELMAMFSADGVGYAHAEWDSAWNSAKLSSSAITLTTSSSGHYFVAWKKGSIVPDADTIRKADTSGNRKNAIHLASFDESFRSVAIMEWLFAQTTKAE